MDDGGLVTAATSNPAAGSALLLADYAPTHDRGLPSSKGQTVTVLRSEPEWAQVRNADGKTGCTTGSGGNGDLVSTVWSITVVIGVVNA